MGKIVVFPARNHARASAGISGKRSGLSELRETPVSRSIGNTNSAGTPRFDLLSQYQSGPCVVPIRLARQFWPPARSMASSSASLGVMESNYPFLGGDQPKTMWRTTDQKLGSLHNMEQPIDLVGFATRLKEKREEVGLSQTALGKLSGYSQTNIGWLESGDCQDPRTQAQDVAKHLRTTADWLLYGTGVRDTVPPPMTPEELAHDYADFPLAAKDAVTAYISGLKTELRKNRKSK